MIIFVAEDDDPADDDKEPLTVDEASDSFNIDDDDFNLGEMNRRLKPFRDQQRRDEDDRRSTFTTSTMASSIAPEVVKQRVKVRTIKLFLPKTRLLICDDILELFWALSDKINEFATFFQASMEKKKRDAVVKRIRSKGNASAVNKVRQENQHEVKASTDAFWGWKDHSQSKFCYNYIRNKLLSHNCQWRNDFPFQYFKMSQWNEQSSMLSPSRTF